jgi:hypothetical protein
MENSFYYFFSAVPQVLGAIMALFGVFVLFKLQQLSTGLLILGENLHNAANNTSQSHKTDEVTRLLKLVRGVAKEVKYKNINGINQILISNTATIAEDSPLFVDIRKEFFSTYKLYSDMINKTKRSTIVSACTIVFCFSLLPFGKWITCNQILLFIMFFVVLVSVGIIFYQLIKILKIALD